MSTATLALSSMGQELECLPDGGEFPWSESAHSSEDVPWIADGEGTDERLTQALVSVNLPIVANGTLQK